MLKWLKRIFQGSEEVPLAREIAVENPVSEHNKQNLSSTNIAEHTHKTVVFFDCETTGLHSEDRIVTFAGIRLRTDQFNHENLSLSYIYLIFDPERKSHPRAEVVHGYDDWALRHQEKFDRYAIEIHEFLHSADLIVAHNAAFDVAFLNREFSLCNLPTISTPVSCTMLEWRLHNPGEPSSLDAVSKQYGFRRRGKRHGAFEDAWLVMTIFLASKGVRSVYSIKDNFPGGSPHNFVNPPPLPDRPLPRRRRMKKADKK